MRDWAPTSATQPSITPPRLRTGRAAWTPFSCIRWSDRWFLGWWSSAFSRPSSSARSPLMDAVQAAIEDSGKWIGRCFRMLRSARCWSTASGSGVGSVVVFLPQILLLFLFIGILEDSGLSGARRADRGPHHGAASACRARASFRCCRPTPARCRPSWPRAPSRTSATASPPF